MHRVLPFLAAVAIVIGFVNFFWFLGAATGHRGNPSTPIPVWITHPLMLLGMAYLLFGLVFPAAIGRQGATEAAEREQVLRVSGPALAAANPGGQIGSLTMSRGLLAVQVFPGGILLKPRFMRSAVIPRSEITGPGVKQALLGGRYVEVTCTSSGVNFAPWSSTSRPRATSRERSSRSWACAWPLLSRAAHVEARFENRNPRHPRPVSQRGHPVLKGGARGFTRTRRGESRARSMLRVGEPHRIQNGAAVGGVRANPQRLPATGAVHHERHRVGRLARGQRLVVGRPDQGGHLPVDQQ